MTPAATVWWGMVLLASGIVDEGPGRVRGCVSTALSCGCGCGTSCVRVWLWGFGTLLGFEESHPLPGRLVGGWLGCLLCLSLPVGG
jgi:hypothetical protein